MNQSVHTGKDHLPPLAKPPAAITALILSMALIATGSGLIFAYIPIRLGELGYAPSVAGWILTFTATGGFVGCVISGPMAKHVGHARAYMSLGALLILSHMGLSLSQDPWIWMGARMVYGVAVTGLFIISQSWLNDACPNSWRGRVIGVFYMSYVVCIGAGGYFISFVDTSGNAGPQLAIIFVTCAIIAVGLTSLRAPPSPDSVTASFKGVWKISPVGLIGVFTVGGLTMLVQGFAPIYASAVGYDKNEIGLLLFLMQFGMIVIQMPLGILSDRIDRRIVLVIACCLVCIFAALTSQLDTLGLWGLILLFAIWAGATETIYSVSNAHANDRADPEYYVTVSSTMLLTWSIAGFIFPGITSILTDVVGPKAFMYVAIGMSAAFGVFALYRMARRGAVASDAQEGFEPRPAQAPYSPELYAPAMQEDVDQKELKP